MNVNVKVLKENIKMFRIKMLEEHAAGMSCALALRQTNSVILAA